MIQDLIKLEWLKKKSSVNISNSIFKLHSKWTVCILVILSMLVGGLQFKKPIDCMADEVPADVLNAYCWISATFTIPSSLSERVGVDVIQPGVRNPDPEEDIKDHKYYQWVSFALLFQALLFYIPHYLWKTWEGGRLRELIKNVPSQLPDLHCDGHSDMEDDVCRRLQNDKIKQNQNSHLKEDLMRRYGFNDLDQGKQINTIVADAIRRETVKGVKTKYLECLVRSINAPCPTPLNSMDVWGVVEAIEALKSVDEEEENSKQDTGAKDKIKINKNIITQDTINAFSSVPAKDIDRTYFRKINRIILDIYYLIAVQQDDLVDAQKSKENRLNDKKLDLTERSYWDQYDEFLKELNGCLQAVIDGKKWSKNEELHSMVDYFAINKGSHKVYMLKLFFCEVLNFINVVGQLLLVDFFLDGEFSTYGWKVWHFLIEDPDERTDPMALVFPKIAKCSFHKYGGTGTVQKFDGLCVLPVNIVNEKIYVFLWFWFAFLAIATGIWLIFRSLSIIFNSPVKINATLVAEEDMKMVNNICKISGLSRSDLLMLAQVKNNIDPYTFVQFIKCLHHTWFPVDIYEDKLLMQAVNNLNFFPPTVSNISKEQLTGNFDIEKGFTDKNVDISQRAKYL